VFQFVSCEKIFSAERTLASGHITGESSRLVILLMSPEVFGACVSLSTVAVVHRLAFRSFADSPGPCSVDFTW
jgi:hypothetical protein